MVHLTDETASRPISQASAGGNSPSEEKKPFWVTCGACKHTWAAAYLPMEVDLFAKLAKTRCPMCAHGPKGILIAKQDNGKLLEPEVT